MAQSQEPLNLEERLREDLKVASRARDQIRMDTIRLALGAIHNEEVARTDSKHPHARQPLTEEDRVAILDKQVKQRDEAAQIYRAAGRDDLAGKEIREAEILRAYLPSQMTDDEIRALVMQLASQHGSEFRTIMPQAAKLTKGRADGKRVQQIVREVTG